jgi:hypothetical protein
MDRTAFYAGPGGFLFVQDSDVVMNPNSSFGDATLFAHGYGPPLTGHLDDVLTGQGTYVKLSTLIAGSVAGGASWVPLSLGVEQAYDEFIVTGPTATPPSSLVFVSNGAGEPILVAYE